MAVTTTYYDEFGNRYELVRDSDGFWVSAPSPDPVHFETAFTATGTLDTALTIQMRGVESDWFQVDNVKLYGNDDIDDNYAMSIRDYNDAEPSGNPQLYREISQFPNPLEEILVPVNEFITHSSFNAILGKMEENYQFLIDKADFLSVPPNAVSFRYGPSSYPDWVGAGNVWMQLANGYSQYWGYDPSMNVDHVAGTPETMVYSTNNVLYAVNMLSGSDPNPSGNPVPSRDFYIYGEDKFTDIKSVEVGSDNSFWILDDAETHGKIGIFSFNTNWKFESSWDVTVPTNPKHFIDPTDLKVSGGMVYVSCNAVSGVEIRVFTEVGSYEGSMSHEDLTAIESIAVTAEYIIALSDNKVYRFNMNYEFVDVIDLFEQIFEYTYLDSAYIPSTIKRLANNTNGAFFYGIAGNLIYKFGQGGSILESFGETAVNYVNSTINSPSDAKPISDIYHDSNYNLYASSEYDVIKYFDRAEIFNRLLDNDLFHIDESVWKLDELGVGSDENTTAWVYNRVFDRILDNLNIYRLALKGSQALIATSSFERVVVDNFSPTQFIPLDWNKGDIVIGINELHCEGALNRCIRQLQDCFDICLGYINIKDVGIDPDVMKIQSFVLKTQDPFEPFADFIDGIYYYEHGHSISDFKFEWTDSITYRGDPKLEAFMNSPISGDFALSKSPVPNSFTDPNSYSTGSRTWTLTENYGGISDSASITVSWSPKLYAGTMLDSVDLNTADGIEILAGDVQWRTPKSTFDGVLPIDVSNSDRYFIAVPTNEYNSNTFQIFHPDYDSMEYFWPVNRTTILNFAGTGASYDILTCAKITGVNPYSPGISQINFRLVRDMP